VQYRDKYVYMTRAHMPTLVEESIGELSGHYYFQITFKVDVLL